MKKFGVLLLIIFSPLTKVWAQQLYPDSSNTIPEEQLSMVIPPDTATDATIAIDTGIGNQWVDIGWWIPAPTAGQPICVSEIVTLTYTVTITVPQTVVAEPGTGVMQSPYTTGGWRPRCRHGCGIRSDEFFVPDPNKGWHEIDLFNQDSLHNSESISGFSQTNARQISSSPPAQTPETPQPVPIPEQPWYEAILPTPLRIRKS